MKKIIFLITVFFASCGACKSLTLNIQEAFFIKTQQCPENVFCSLELIPNKSIEFKTDEFGNNYPVITEGEKTILKYSYIKNPLENTQDSNYTELIYAELDQTIKEISLTNENLQKVKLYFGRLCYCKGETGYYEIKEGTFNLSKITEDSLNITIEFNITEVPKIISKIDETISLKGNATK